MATPTEADSIGKIRISRAPAKDALIPWLVHHKSYYINVPNKDFRGEAFSFGFHNGQARVDALENFEPEIDRVERVINLYECFNANYEITYTDGREVEEAEPGALTVKSKQFPDEVPVEERLVRLLMAAQEARSDTSGFSREEVGDIVNTAVAEALRAARAEDAEAESQSEESASEPALIE